MFRITSGGIALWPVRLRCGLLVSVTTDLVRCVGLLSSQAILTCDGEMMVGPRSGMYTPGLSKNGTFFMTEETWDCCRDRRSLGQACSAHLDAEQEVVLRLDLRLAEVCLDYMCGLPWIFRLLAGAYSRPFSQACIQKATRSR